MKKVFLPVCIVLLAVTGCSATGQKAVLPEYDEVTDYTAGTIINAMPIEVVEPEYPRAALVECVGGLVEVVMEVDEMGLAQNIDVLHAEPGDLFVRSTLEALFKWRFKTPTRDGKPVPSRQKLPVEYNKPGGC